MRILGLVCTLAFLSGCALVEDKVPIDYVAPPNLEVAAGASAVTVTVNGEDGRAANKDRISSKKNGYGMEMARILATNDVVELVRTAVEQELESLGFKTGPGGILIKVQLETFYNDFKIGFFSGDAVAEVAFTLTANKPDGSYLYSRSYKGIGMHPNILLASGEYAKAALQEALTNAMRQFVQDETLRQVLVQGGTPSPVRTSGTGGPQRSSVDALEKVPGS